MIRPSSELRPMVVYGAGGHGQVVAEAAAEAGRRVLGFLDDGAGEGRDLPWPMLHPRDPRLASAAYIVAIGDNAARRRITEELTQADRRIESIAHPTAWVSPSATLGLGVFVGPGAVVHTAAQLGRGAIVNSHAVIEHHCTLGDFSHVAPGAALGGAATLGADSLVGLNATLLPRIHVGHACTVAAGAVVTADVPDGQTVVGVPARRRG